MSEAAGSGSGAAADCSSAGAAAFSCSTRVMAQQHTPAALVQQPRVQHMSEAADKGIGAATNAAALVQQLVAAAQVRSR